MGRSWDKGVFYRLTLLKGAGKGGWGVVLILCLSKKLKTFYRHTLLQGAGTRLRGGIVPIWFLWKHSLFTEWGAARTTFVQILLAFNSKQKQWETFTDMYHRQLSSPPPELLLVLTRWLLSSFLRKFFNYWHPIQTIVTICKEISKEILICSITETFSFRVFSYKVSMKVL